MKSHFVMPILTGLFLNFKLEAFLELRFIKLTFLIIHENSNRRGPNTYTRKWEEEEAYQKPRGGQRGSRGGSGRGRPSFKDSNPTESVGYEQDFPELGNKSRGGGRKGSGDGEENTPPTKSRPLPHPKRNSNMEEGSNHKVIEESTREDRGNRRGGRGSGEPRVLSRRPDWDMRDDRGDDGEYRDRDRGTNRGFSRGGRGRGRRNEFRNRNLYPDRRDGGSGQDSNTGTGNVDDEDAAWEKKVEEIRKIDTAEKNNAAGNKGSANRKSEFSPPSNQNQLIGSTSSSGHKGYVAEKKTLPFTNTEYTGSASLTAQRNYSAHSGQSSGHAGTRKFDDHDTSSRGNRQVAFQHETEQVSVKLVNPAQSANNDYGNRERAQPEQDNRDERRRRPLQRKFT